MRIEVREHRGPAALQALREEWDGLFASCGAETPFASWHWLEAWWRHLALDRTPRILCAWQGSQLVGLLPLAEERLDLLPGAQVRRLSFLGERWGGADYLDVLAPAELRRPVAQAIFDHLARGETFDCLDLDGIAADSPTLEVLERRFGEDGGFRHECVERHVCPQVILDGDFASILKRGRRGENFRRRLKKLRALDGFEHRVVRDPAEAPAAFERFLDLHERRWAVQGGSDAMGRPALQRFHREVVVRLAEAGRLRFDELWAGGGCRATIYGIDAGRTHLFYQTGYDPDWAKQSVGLVCLGLSIEAAVERGQTRYDFLHGEETYKFDWATEVRRTRAVRVVARRLPTALLLARQGAEQAARSMAHALLPNAAVDLLRRLRRARERRHDEGRKIQ